MGSRQAGGAQAASGALLEGESPVSRFSGFSQRRCAASPTQSSVSCASVTKLKASPGCTKLLGKQEKENMLVLPLLLALLRDHMQQHVSFEAHNTRQQEQDSSCYIVIW